MTNDTLPNEHYEYDCDSCGTIEFIELDESIPDNSIPADIQLSNCENATIVSLGIDKLTKTQSIVIRCRYYTEPAMTQQQVSELIGVTRQRVAQIEAEALAALKKMVLNKSKVGN